MTTSQGALFRRPAALVYRLIAPSSLSTSTAQVLLHLGDGPRDSQPLVRRRDPGCTHGERSAVRVLMEGLGEALGLDYRLYTHTLSI